MSIISRHVKYKYVNQMRMIKESNKNIYMVNPYFLVRDCYIGIYSELKKIITDGQYSSEDLFAHHSLNPLANLSLTQTIYSPPPQMSHSPQENADGKGSASDEDNEFQPQKCFLVYGNEGTGKTCLCIFLAYCFNHDEDFKDYNVIFFGEVENVIKYYFREATGKNYSETDKLPETTGKSIIISDSCAIKEDDFSDDDVVIMISSPNAKKYKLMSNKRSPVQFYLPCFTKAELEEIIHKVEGEIDEDEYNMLLNECIDYGYILEGVSTPELLGEHLKFNAETDILPSYIPPEYNERCYIYNAERINDIPDELKFKSNAIKNYIIDKLHNNYKIEERHDQLQSYYSERSRVLYQPKAYSDLSIEIYRNNFKNDDIKRDYKTFDRIVDNQNKIDKTKNNIDEKDTREIKQLLKNEYERIEKTVKLDVENDEVKEMKELIMKDDNDADIDKNREKYIETLKSIWEELPKYCVNRSTTNALCKVFGDSIPIYDEKDKTITIGCKIYQYPRKIVYIRDVYKEIWNELMLFILFVKLRKYKDNASENIVKINKIIKELNDHNHVNIELKEVSDDDDLKDNINKIKNVLNELAKMKIEGEKKIKKIDINSEFNFLLRGNPGCGKTSFIIYLLKKIIELGVAIDDPVITNIYKSKTEHPYYNTYSLKDSKVVEGRGKEECEIEISDSFNHNSTKSTSPIVLYIASLDHNNYDGFFTTTRRRFYYYMDVFSNSEIKEWEEKCLPKKLNDSIINNGFNSKYGNVPRHIFYAAIYDVCYGKDYWVELYTKGIKRIVGDLGFMEFIMTYLYPRKSNDERNRISGYNIRLYDSTLCHYIVKYSIPFKTENTSTKCYDKINEYEMEFISDDVFDYIYDCIKHKAGEEDINEIQDIFKNVYVKGKNTQLLQLMFQELVWYNCLFHYVDFERNLGIRLERIHECKFETFKKLFNSDIYSTAKKECNVSNDDGEIYLLHLATVENKEMIYLLNNCFIHIMNENEGVKECNNDFIKKCMIYLKYKMKWCNFYYIFVSSERKTTEQSNVKSTKHHISSHLIGIEKMKIDEINDMITKVSVEGKEISLSGNISWHSCECQFNQNVYRKYFAVKDMKDYSIQCVVERNNNVQQQQQNKHKKRKMQSPIQQQYLPPSKKQYQPHPALYQPLPHYLQYPQQHLQPPIEPLYFQNTLEPLSPSSYESLNNMIEEDDDEVEDDEEEWI